MPSVRLSPATRERLPIRYLTNVGPTSGPIRWRHNHGAIGVLQAPDDHTPIGMALGSG
jgi:hypothetical protein